MTPEERLFQLIQQEANVQNQTNKNSYYIDRAFSLFEDQDKRKRFIRLFMDAKELPDSELDEVTKTRKS